MAGTLLFIYVSRTGDAAMDAQKNLQKILRSPSFCRAYEDIDFLKRDDLRPVRLQLELLKPELLMNEQKIRSTIVVFGSARLRSEEQAKRALAAAEKRLQADPHSDRARREYRKAQLMLKNSCYYEEAREFARIVSTSCQIDGECDFVMVTGGGPGIMEAANRGAFDVGAKSVGLNITIKHEQEPNPYITPELCFQFHYFALRKMHFLMRAKALVVFPGGFGTLDELFETLTLIQTQKVKPIPVLLFAQAYWQKLINFDFLASEGMIARDDLKLFRYVEKATEAWEVITDFYAKRGEWPNFSDGHKRQVG